MVTLWLGWSAIYVGYDDKRPEKDKAMQGISWPESGLDDGLLTGVVDDMGCVWMD